MGRPQQRNRPQRRLGYRNAVLADARGRPLVYADGLAIIPAGRGGTVGVAGATFAAGILERLGAVGIPTVRVLSAGRPRVILRGLRISFHAGGQRLPEGGRHVQAAVGTYRSLERI